MGLDFERIKHKVEHGTGHQWTSYSDLFLVLSVTFLLLYMIANLRGGAAAVVAQEQIRVTSARMSELEKQIKAYEVLKEDYIEKGASQDEVAMYRELEDQLQLLNEQAKSEAEDTAQKAREAKLKFNGLNRYQALVKNIVNANMVASAKTKRQLTMLDSRDEKIEEKDVQIDELDVTTKAQEKEIEKNQGKIAKIKQDLIRRENSIKNLKHASAQERKEAEQSLKEARHQASTKIAELEQTQKELDKKSKEANRLTSELSAVRAKHDQVAAQEREKYEKLVNEAKVTAAQKAEAAKVLRDKLARAEQEMNAKISALGGEVEGAKRKLASAELANSNLQRDLNVSVNKLNAQRKLAQQIKANLKAVGVDAAVDQKTGDVTISFGDEYFDTGSAMLKPGMREIVRRTIPVYAKSLFETAEIARKLESVEIVGFASPTFQGRVVDPQSMASSDRAAVNYNMDLSYRRARSIFDFVTDQKKIVFERQKDLLPLIKVSGRSYLSADRVPANSGGVSDTDYCQKFNCQKHQIVVIRFTLRE